jgi:hypothetical protein
MRTTRFLLLLAEALVDAPITGSAGQIARELHFFWKLVTLRAGERVRLPAQAVAWK